MPSKDRRLALPTRAVRLEVFDIHGHNRGRPLNYEAFFSLIGGLSGKSRQETIADRVISVPLFRRQGPVFVFSAYMGSPGSSFLVIDLENGEEEVRAIEKGKILATRTVGVIDPKQRIAVVQFVRTGVRAQQITALLEKLAHNQPQFEGATLEFAPRAGEEFRKEVLSFKRIQSAALTLTRPNYDWSDYSDTLNGLAQDSNAHSVSVAASASRSQALSKTEGVVKVLRELISGKGRSILKSAEVHGTREGEDTLTTVKLKRLTESRTVNVTLSGGLPDGEAVRNAAADYIRGIENKQ